MRPMAVVIGLVIRVNLLRRCPKMESRSANSLPVLSPRWEVEASGVRIYDTGRESLAGQFSVFVASWGYTFGRAGLIWFFAI